MSRQLSLCLALAFLAVAASAGVSLTEGKAALTVKHPAYTLTLHPAQGGKGELSGLTAPDTKGVSLLRECFGEKAMETAPADIPYTYTVDKNDGKTVAITFQATLSKAAAGADLDGVELRRTVTVTADRPYVEVTVELRNPTKEVRYAALGIQNRFRVEKFGGDYCYLPTTRNVLDISPSGSVFGYYGVGSWEYEPVEGWLGVCDGAAKRGLAFVMDYDALEAFYNQSGTHGWTLDLGELPPGAAVSTRYLAAPFQGLGSLCFASDRMLAETRVTPLKDKTLLSRTLLPLEPLGDFTLEGSLLDVRSGGMKALAPVRTLATQVAAGGAMTGPVVVRSKVVGKGWEQVFELMYEGQFHAQPIPNLQLAVERRRPMPARQAIKRLTEGTAPSVQAVAKGKRALLFYGVYTQWYKLDDALKGWDVKISNARPVKAEYLPPASEISKYSLVILSDVTAEALPASVIRRLESFVRKGGSLLVLGGPYAYGHGRYAEKGLEAVLPVEGHPFDLAWDKEGVPFRKTKEHAITKGIDFAAAPMVYWHHQAKVKKSGELLLAAGDYDPLLVVQPYGAGKVACFLGSPLGEGRTPFWEWDGWPKLMKNTVEWLNAAEVK